MTETNDDAPTRFVLSGGERDLDQLRELLAARGWRVEPSPDGLEEWIVRPDGSRAGVVRREPLSPTPPSLMLSIQGLIEKLKPYSRKLRIDASGEDGRMSATDMYALADRLDELASLLPTLPADEPETDCTTCGDTGVKAWNGAYCTCQRGLELARQDGVFPPSPEVK